MSKVKILISIIMLFFIISLATSVSAKYVIEYNKKIGEINIDRTPPKVEVTYSTQAPTSEGIIVTLSSNEPIKQMEGWISSNNLKELKKVYYKNIEEKIFVSDLYNNYSPIIIKIDNIDKTVPKIELIQISNTNEKYNKYANKNHCITVKVKVFEKNINVNNISPDNVLVKIGEVSFIPPNMIIKETEKDSEGITYDIILKNLEGNGLLKLIIKDGIIMDIGNRTNEKLEIDSGITIDNIGPEVGYRERKLENGKASITLNASEFIREKEGWKILEDKSSLYKEFTNNVYYEMEVIDYAQNITKVIINVKTATYIKLTYCSHNSEIGWSYGYGNTDIAGNKALNINTNYKTEALAFKIEGNIEKDFIQAKAYVYSHWGEGSECTCGDTGMIYRYGYNPELGYKSMESSDLVAINGEKYFQFGGVSINSPTRPDINGNNPIPKELEGKYPYGISAIILKLKDYSYYSIVYQIYVKEKGWIEPCINGEEAKYSYDKPMSAIRISLVPKTEEKDIIGLWKKDVH